MLIVFIASILTSIWRSQFAHGLNSDMMGEMLKKDYPQMEDYTRIYNSSGDRLIKKGNDYIDEYKVAHVDSTFFNYLKFR